ncbi:hypothetical protein EYF80_056012 [Liparis tanakae]|uniref:Uncharacterized protein n=1 Tax=Liparis tanakae TaxID=230148 RepID=A0A4Z2EY72_9TELE|nr:hypothetical protein EYF80_056012 [Liparis tanakae]
MEVVYRDVLMEVVYQDVLMEVVYRDVLMEVVCSDALMERNEVVGLKCGGRAGEPTVKATSVKSGEKILDRLAFVLICRQPVDEVVRSGFTKHRVLGGHSGAVFTERGTQLAGSAAIHPTD